MFIGHVVHLCSVLTKAPSRSFNQVIKHSTLTLESRQKQPLLPDLSLHMLIWNNQFTSHYQDPAAHDSEEVSRTSPPISDTPNTSMPLCIQLGRQVQRPHGYISVDIRGGVGDMRCWCFVSHDQFWNDKHDTHTDTVVPCLSGLEQVSGEP